MNLKNLRYSLIFLCLGFVLSTIEAQDTQIIDYGEKKSYEIGGVTIQGAVNRDRNAIKSIAGLREGGKVQIPGPAIPTAIKALLKLRLFEDVQVFQDSLKGNIVYLKIVLIERPTLSKYSYKGVKTSQHEELNDIIKNIITKGGIVTDDQKELARQKVRQFFVAKGRLDTEVKVNEIAEPSKTTSAVRVEFVVNQKEKVKVKDIVIEGNNEFSDRKLRKKMEKTKRKGTLLKKSKFIAKDYEADVKNIVKFYHSEGYKNMSIVSDTTYRGADGNITAKLVIEEGKRHFFRNIKWKGNSLYTDEYLHSILGIGKGDIYNPELLNNRLKFSLDGRDISSLYLDDGYLSFDVTPTEISVENDMG